MIGLILFILIVFLVMIALLMISAFLFDSDDEWKEDARELIDDL